MRYNKLFILGIFLIFLFPFSFSQAEEGLNDSEEIAPSPNESFIEEQLASLEKPESSSNSVSKIIIFSLILIVFGIIIYFIYLKIKNGEIISKESSVLKKPVAPVSA